MIDTILVRTVSKLHTNPRAREWCKLPYSGHPHGCPNYGGRATCPPQAPLVGDFIDTSEVMFLVAVRFDLSSHMIEMARRHPEWSERQCRCVRYWQPAVNKVLREAVSAFVSRDSGFICTTCPEAMGVNVITTAWDCGIPVRVHPERFVYKIALVGRAKK